MADVGPVSPGVSLPRPAGFDAPPIGLRRPEIPLFEPSSASDTLPVAPPLPQEDSGAQEQLRNSLERDASLQVLYRYGVRERTGDFYVQVLDVRTSEVHKTIPMEELLDLRERLRDQVGLILDKRA